MKKEMKNIIAWNFELKQTNRVESGNRYQQGWGDLFNLNSI